MWQCGHWLAAPLQYPIHYYLEKPKSMGISLLRVRMEKDYKETLYLSENLGSSRIV